MFSQPTHVVYHKIEYLPSTIYNVSHEYNTLFYKSLKLK